VDGGEHKGTVYYGNKSLFSSAIQHEGDNRTGDGDGDDEVINMDLDKIPVRAAPSPTAGLLGRPLMSTYVAAHNPNANRAPNTFNTQANVLSLHVVVNAYTGSFSDVKDAYVRLVAIKTGHELARFTLDNAHTQSGVVFAKISRIAGQHGAWRLLAIGKGCAGRSATNDATKTACGIAH
jgi:stress response protein SCP2